MVALVTNVIWLCVRCGIESTTAEFRTMLIGTTKAEPSTKATMTQNQCCTLFLFSIILNLKK